MKIWHMILEGDINSWRKFSFEFFPFSLFHLRYIFTGKVCSALRECNLEKLDDTMTSLWWQLDIEIPRDRRMLMIDDVPNGQPQDRVSLNFNLLEFWNRGETLRCLGNLWEAFPSRREEKRKERKRNLFSDLSNRSIREKKRKKILLEIRVEKRGKKGDRKLRLAWQFSPHCFEKRVKPWN